MKLIEATEINDTNLISTNVPENDKPEWLIGTPYSIGSQVMVLETHKLYEALTENTGLYPPDNLTGDNPAWLDIGSTNAWKMFNQSYAARTENIGSIQVSFSLGRTNSIGILNVEASSINVTMEIDGVEVYNHDVDMQLRVVTNFYEYIYTPLELKTEAVLTDLPTAGNTTLTVTLTGGPEQLVKCGLCIPGNAIKLGDSLWGLSGGTDNYSRKDVDIYGGFDVTTRNFSKTRTVDIFLPNERTGYIERLLQPYYTKAGLWIASEKYEFTHVYGFYRDFSIVLTDWAVANCSLTIEGLT